MITYQQKREHSIDLPPNVQLRRKSMQVVASESVKTTANSTRYTVTVTDIWLTFYASLATAGPDAPDGHRPTPPRVAFYVAQCIHRRSDIYTRGSYSVLRLHNRGPTLGLVPTTRLYLASLVVVLQFFFSRWSIETLVGLPARFRMVERPNLGCQNLERIARLGRRVIEDSTVTAHWHTISGCWAAQQSEAVCQC